MSRTLGVLEVLGVTEIFTEDFGDYQGATISIVKRRYPRNKTYGVFTEDYGSCSGCDAWEAAEGNLEEMLELVTGIVGEIEWFKTFQELKDYLASRTKANSWFCNEREWKSFLERVLALEDK